LFFFSHPPSDPVQVLSHQTIILRPNSFSWIIFFFYTLQTILSLLLLWYLTNFPIVLYTFYLCLVPQFRLQIT
jgi:hypothetical protein